MNMNEEKLRNLLFGSKSKSVPLQTIRLMDERGVLPKHHGEFHIRQWKNSFIGDFLLNHPSRSGLIMDIKEAIGKIPTLSDFTERNLNKIAEILQKDKYQKGGIGIQRRTGHFGDHSVAEGELQQL